MAEKRYYWLKLQDGFFGSIRIKKLRRIAGGDTYTIIYLKMQLVAMKNEGVLVYTGLEPTFADELALDLDEDRDNVEVTINYLLSCGLMETDNEREYFLPYAVENTGSEGASTKRVREFRKRDKAQKALHCNADVTQCNANETTVKQNRNGEKEIEKDIDISLTRDKNIGAKKRPALPTLEEVEAYVFERGNKISASEWFDYYSSNGWMVGRTKMKDWKAAVRTWEAREKEFRRGNTETPPKKTSGRNAPMRAYEPGAAEEKSLAWLMDLPSGSGQ